MKYDMISKHYGPQPDAAAAAAAPRGVAFGAVVVPLAALTDRDRQQAILHSQAVLAAAAEWLLGKPGIDAGMRGDLPRYAVDPDDPALLIRRCGGVVTRGRLDQGAFQVTP